MSTFAQGAPEPWAIAIDAEDGMAVLGAGGVYRVAPDGKTRLLAATTGGVNLAEADRLHQIADPQAIALGPDGSVWVSAYKWLYHVLPDGTLTAQPGPAQQYELQSAVMNRWGTLYIALRDEGTIWRLTPGGTGSLYAGQPGRSYEPTPLVDGPALEARFSMPTDLAMDDQNNLYVADSGHGAIRKITPDGMVSTVFGQARPPLPPSPSPGESPAPQPSLPPFVALENLALAPGGGFYVTVQNRLMRLSPDGQASLVAGGEAVCDMVGLASVEATPSSACFAEGMGAEARFDRPSDMVVDRRGTLFVTDRRNGRLRRID